MLLAQIYLASNNAHSFACIYSILQIFALLWRLLSLWRCDETSNPYSQNVSYILSERFEIMEKNSVKCILSCHGNAIKIHQQQAAGVQNAIPNDMEKKMRKCKKTRSFLGTSTKSEVTFIFETNTNFYFEYIYHERRHLFIIIIFFLMFVSAYLSTTRSPNQLFQINYSSMPSVLMISNKTLSQFSVDWKGFKFHRKFCDEPAKTLADFGVFCAVFDWSSMIDGVNDLFEAKQKTNFGKKTDSRCNSFPWKMWLARVTSLPQSIYVLFEMSEWFCDKTSFRSKDNVYLHKLPF